jgi:hypothetical protein
MGVSSTARRRADVRVSLRVQSYAVSRMPTFVPRNGTKIRRKPWFARAKFAGEHFSLGYFLTREEAATTEDEFKRAIREEAAARVRR